MRIIAALTAALLFVLAAAACSGGSGSKVFDEGITGPARQTQEALHNASQTQIAAADASITPTIPGELSSPETLMFCVPLQQAGQSGGPGTPLAVVPPGTQVYYQPGTCQPDVDGKGDVALGNTNALGIAEVAKNPDGTVKRVTPQYTTSAINTPDQIVWAPAQGELKGTPTVMTGKFIKTDAQAENDQLGQSLLSPQLYRRRQAGVGLAHQAHGSPTEGLPLAVFLDGEPIRGRDGHVIAPRVQAEITETTQFTGLSGPDARNLVALINSGMLR